MQIKQNPLRALGRATAMAAFAATASLCLHAQQTVSSSGPKSFTFVQPSDSLLFADTEVSNLLGYSSSAGSAEVTAAESYLSSSLPAAPDASPQPPPRRYGRRPVYADSRHNADGSNKYTFLAGGGFTLPTGGTHNYLTPNFDLEFGGGRAFNKKVALLGIIGYDRFGIQTNTLNNLLGIYQSLGATVSSGGGAYGTGGGAPTPLTQIGGNTHELSFAIDPQYTFMDGSSWGGYAIGGVGYYHKVTDFTTPGVGTYCDPYYGCYQYQANQKIDAYVSNAVGVNGGFGATYKPSRFSNIKFYAEARYIYTANSKRQFYDGAQGTVNPTPSPTYFNVFPQNSAKTTYIPITFGIRF